MTGAEITPTDRLMFEIEQSLNQTYHSDAEPTFSADILAEKGKAAVTSLYVESFRAIDALPKVLSIRRLGKSALSNEAEDLLQHVDQAIELNPIYDSDEYEAGQGRLEYYKSSAPPARYLTHHEYRGVLPERGLASMRHAVRMGFSKKSPDTREWQAHVPANLLRTMELNDTIDSDVMQTLRTVRSEGNYSTAEYVSGLVKLAEHTTRKIIDKPNSGLLNHRGEIPLVTLARKVTGEAVFIGTTAVIGGGLTDSAILLCGGHPNKFAAIGALTGSFLASRVRARRQNQQIRQTVER